MAASRATTWPGSRPGGRRASRSLRRCALTSAALAAAGVPEAELEALVTRVRVIQDSPALRAAANALLYRQRDALAGALAGEYGATAAGLIAAQVAASLLTMQESYFQRLLDGVSPADGGRLLARDVELAFDLLEHGISRIGEGVTCAREASTTTQGRSPETA